jgi:hypothetical protein
MNTENYMCGSHCSLPSISIGQHRCREIKWPASEMGSLTLFPTYQAWAPHRELISKDSKEQEEEHGTQLHTS